MSGAGSKPARRLHRAMRAMAVLLGIGVSGMALNGCATLVPRLEPPELTVTSVEIVGGSLQEQRLHLTLHVVNPNARVIDVRSIECTLELSGEPFAAGTTDAPFKLPASGATDFGLNVTAHLDAGLAAALSGFGHRKVEYHLYGVVHLASGLVRNIPFDQHNQLKF
jgi:LEA14-like dessication related protein